MKELITIVGFMGWLTVCAAQGTTDLTVRIDKLEDTLGQILIALFDQPDGFPEAGETAFRSERIVPAEQSVTVCFRDLSPGIYAVCFVHDKNMNYRLDKNMGIPAEKYGVSNNIKMGFGPPKFNEARFYLGNKDTSICITPAF